MATTIVKKQASSNTSTPMMLKMVRSNSLDFNNYNLTIQSDGSWIDDENISFIAGSYGNIISIDIGQLNNLNLDENTYNYTLMDDHKNTLVGELVDTIVTFYTTQEFCKNFGNRKILFLIDENNSGNLESTEEVFVSNELNFTIEKSLWTNDIDAIELANENDSLPSLYKKIIDINYDNSLHFNTNDNGLGNEGDAYISYFRDNSGVNYENKYLLAYKNNTYYKFKYSGNYCVIPTEITKDAGSWQYAFAWENTQKRIVSNTLKGNVISNFLTNGDTTAILEDINTIEIVDEASISFGLEKDIGKYVLPYSGADVEELLDKTNNMNITNGEGQGSLVSTNLYKVIASNSDKTLVGEVSMPQPIVTGNSSIAFGGVRPDRWDEYLNGSKKLTTVIGDFSYAFGVGNYINDNYSFAGGKDNILYQGGQTAFGGGNKVGFTKEEFESFYSKTNENGEIINDDGYTYEQSWGFNLVGGTLNNVKGLENIVGGLENNIYSYQSIISGDRNEIGVNKNMAYHVIVNGSNNKVKNSNTLQVGQNNVTDALNSINGGSGNVNYGNNNILVGINSKVNAGGNTCANILGEGLIANAPHQTVLGKFNATNSDALFQIGNGESDSSRSTLFEVEKDGKAKLLDDNIATEHYVNPHTHTVTNYNDLPKTYDNAIEGAIYLVLDENLYYACVKNHTSKTVEYVSYNYTVQSSTPFMKVGHNGVRPWKYLYAQYENKGYVEAVAFTSTTQPWSIPQREGNGQITVGAPTTDDHATTKKYVDNKDAEIKKYVDDKTFIKTKIKKVTPTSIDVNLAKNNYYIFNYPFVNNGLALNYADNDNTILQEFCGEIQLDENTIIFGAKFTFNNILTSVNWNNHYNLTHIKGGNYNLEPKHKYYFSLNNLGDGIIYSKPNPTLATPNLRFEIIDDKNYLVWDSIDNVDYYMLYMDNELIYPQLKPSITQQFFELDTTTTIKIVAHSSYYIDSQAEITYTPTTTE